MGKRATGGRSTTRRQGDPAWPPGAQFCPSALRFNKTLPHKNQARSKNKRPIGSEGSHIAMEHKQKIERGRGAAGAPAHFAGDQSPRDRQRQQPQMPIRKHAASPVYMCVWGVLLARRLWAGKALRCRVGATAAHCAVCWVCRCGSHSTAQQQHNNSKQERECAIAALANGASLPQHTACQSGCVCAPPWRPPTSHVLVVSVLLSRTSVCLTQQRFAV